MPPLENTRVFCHALREMMLTNQIKRTPALVHAKSRSEDEIGRWFGSGPHSELAEAGVFKIRGGVGMTQLTVINN